MEPLRPDEDELRTTEKMTAGETRKPEPRKSPDQEKPARTGSGKEAKSPGRNEPPKEPRNGGGSAVPVLIFLLLVLVAGGGFLWWMQEQRLAALEGQLEEADYWARQSKLALARFEGELTETGESLEQKGATIEQQLAEQRKKIDAAEGEIRKLGERNGKQLVDHEARLVELVESGKMRDASLSKIEQASAEGRTSLESSVKGLDERLERLAEENRQAVEQLTVLTARFDEVDVLVERSLQRFRQEQGLALDGLDGRVSALERTSGTAVSSSQLKKLESRVAEMRKTVDAIDASRAQLTARLVRLSEEVDRLRSQKTQ